MSAVTMHNTIPSMDTQILVLHKRTRSADVDDAAAAVASATERSHMVMAMVSDETLQKYVCVGNTSTKIST